MEWVGINFYVSYFLKLAVGMKNGIMDMVRRDFYNSANST
jgi:hypothetical protein